MLDAMRNRAGSWIAKVFIFLLAASFAVWGVEDVFRGFRGDVLVTVGDVQITAEEYRNVFNRQLRAVSRQLGRSITPEQAREMGLDQQILGQMIREAAFNAQAKSLNLAVPDRAVAHRIATNPAFQTSQGEFNPQDFRRLLVQSGISEAEFVASERQAMMSAAIADTLDSGIRPPQPLVQAIWQHRTERRDVQYFEVRADDIAIPEPSEAELRQFYEDNPSLFEIPERRQIVIIHADPMELGRRVEITQDAIEAAYEWRKGEFGTPERRVIQQIPFANAEEAREALQRIREGAHFLQIAREKGLSQDDATLGELTRDAVPDPAFAEAAFALEEGQVSDPVEGRLSTALLRVTDIIAGEEPSLAEVRDELVSQLQADRGREEVLNLYDEIEDGRAAGQSFEEIAATLNLEVQKLEVDRRGVDPDGRTVELPARVDVLRTAFELDLGIEADPVPTRDEGYVWVEVRDITPATVKRFEEAREDAVAAWQRRKASEAVLERARELKEQAEAGTSLDQLARQVGAEVQSATDIQRGAPTGGLDGRAVEALYGAPAGGYAVALRDDGEGAIVMRSSAVLSPPFDPNSEEARTIANALRVGLGDDLTAQYTTALQANIKVEINETLWQRLAGGRM